MNIIKESKTNTREKCTFQSKTGSNQKTNAKHRDKKRKYYREKKTQEGKGTDIETRQRGKPSGC